MKTIHRDIVGAFIFSNDGHILLGRSRPGGVYPDHDVIPGGGIDDGETPEQAVAREVMEEVSLDITHATVRRVDYVQHFSHEKTLEPDGEKVLVKMRDYDFIITFDLPAAEIKPIAGDDFRLPQWFPVSELPNLKLTDPVKFTLKKLGYL